MGKKSKQSHILDAWLCIVYSLLLLASVLGRLKISNSQRSLLHALGRKDKSKDERPHNSYSSAESPLKAKH